MKFKSKITKHTFLEIPLYNGFVGDMSDHKRSEPPICAKTLVNVRQNGNKLITRGRQRRSGASWLMLMTPLSQLCREIIKRRFASLSETNQMN
jgi:hypothetical protein